jgi:uncharacterized protein (DUF433 family)
MEGIVIDDQILGGTPVFRGTRVPLKTLFDYWASGTNTLQDFLEDYPSVSVYDAQAVIHFFEKQLAAHQPMAV